MSEKLRGEREFYVYWNVVNILFIIECSKLSPFHTYFPPIVTLIPV